MLSLTLNHVHFLPFVFLLTGRKDSLVWTWTCGQPGLQASRGRCNVTLQRSWRCKICFSPKSTRLNIAFCKRNNFKVDISVWFWFFCRGFKSQKMRTQHFLPTLTVPEEESQWCDASSESKFFYLSSKTEESNFIDPLMVPLPLGIPAHLFRTETRLTMSKNDD